MKKNLKINLIKSKIFYSDKRSKKVKILPYFSIQESFKPLRLIT